MPAIARNRDLIIEMLHSTNPKFTYQEIIDTTGTTAKMISTIKKELGLFSKINTISLSTDIKESIIKVYSRHGHPKYKHKVKEFLRS